MRNTVSFVFFLLFATMYGIAQEPTKNDTLIRGEQTKTTPAKKTRKEKKKKDTKEAVVLQDTTVYVRPAINPLAPSKAAFLSSLVPGLGQIYNKKYWKVPIVYVAIGGSIVVYLDNNNNYQRFRTAFKRRNAGFTDDEFYDLNNDNPLGSEPDLDLADLENQQERFQRDRDLWLVLSIITYALNIIDANVDAHLQQFNIDSNLSLNFEPYFDLNNVTNSPNYGMALTLKF